MLADGPYERSGSSLRLVLSLVATVTLVAGVFAYKTYAESERVVKAGLAQLEKAGAATDSEGCVDAVMSWHATCGQAGANAAVCFQGVKLGMFHCLKAQSRTAECEPYQEVQTDNRGLPDLGDWVQMRCYERKTPCKSPRECVCAQAYRSLQSFCKTGETAVQL